MKFLFDDYLIPGEKVLDLGCGNGRFYELFKEKSIDYTGVDNSEKLIEIAKRRYPETKFLIADALNLSFPDNYFDKVYSFAFLHHIPSQEFRLKVLQEIRRVLKKEGVFILTVWKFHAKKEIFLLFKYTILKIIGKSRLDFKDIFKPWGKKIKRYYHWFSKKELENLARKASFQIRKMSVVKNKRGNRQNIYLIAKR